MKGIYKRTEYPTAARSAREELGPPPQERIDKETLQGILSTGGLTKQTNRMLGRLIAEEKLWDEAMELARSDEAQVAFRSAWALEWAYTMDAHPIEARFRRFFEDFLRSGNTSVQRIYSKILYDMVRRGAVATDALQAEALAGKCFDLLTDEKTPVAVKIWQIELLDDLRTRIGWIEENLTEMVRSLSENPECRPAMAAYARRYLRRVTAWRAGGKRNG